MFGLWCQEYPIKLHVQEKMCEIPASKESFELENVQFVVWPEGS